MNSRRALKAVAKRIEEQEHTLALNKRDIQLYNKVVIHMIQGGSPCDYCEDRKECQLSAKDAGVGCPQWWLAFPEEVNANEETTDTDPTDLPFNIDSGDEVRDVPTGQLCDGEGHSEAQRDGSGAI